MTPLGDAPDDVLDVGARNRSRPRTLTTFTFLGVLLLLASVGAAVRYRADADSRRKALAAERIARRTTPSVSPSVAALPPRRPSLSPVLPSAAPVETAAATPVPPVFQDPLIYTVRLPPDGTIHGTLHVVVNADPNGIGASVSVVGELAGGRPRTKYQLQGGNCSGDGQWIWAEGVSDTTGRTALTGESVRVGGTDHLFLTLDPSSRFPGPSLYGSFAGGEVKEYRNPLALCTP